MSTHFSKDRLRKFAPLLLTIGLILIGGGVVVASNYNAFFPKETSRLLNSKLDSDIAQLEESIAKDPVNAVPYVNLASLYLQKVRETSDATYYEKIDALMDKAATIDPTNADIPATRASVAMGRHDFKAGKAYITEALALNDHTAAYYGLSGDADIELGQYDDAVAAFQKMIDIRPDFSSWSRIAYIRELNGDVPGAIEALNESVASGSSYAENIAWAYVERGKLEIRTDIPASEVSFATALQIVPSYAPAMEGLGKAAFARGDMTEAERQFIAAYTTLPLAQYAVDLGDLYAYQGESLKASQQFALAQAAFDLSRKGGVDTDLEESVFIADHDLDTPRSIEMARRAYTDRPNIYSADALSWALVKDGQLDEAAVYTKDALELGEHDPAIMYHQGLLALAQGNVELGNKYLNRAYALNPHFSIQYAGDLKMRITVDN